MDIYSHLCIFNFIKKLLFVTIENINLTMKDIVISNVTLMDDVYRKD